MYIIQTSNKRETYLMKDKLNEWLGKCPLPVVARVIDEKDSLRHLLSTSHVYQDNMLVVIDLKKVSSLLD